MYDVESKCNYDYACSWFVSHIHQSWLLAIIILGAVQIVNSTLFLFNTLALLGMGNFSLSHEAAMLSQTVTSFRLEELWICCFLSFVLFVICTFYPICRCVCLPQTTTIL